MLTILVTKSEKPVMAPKYTRKPAMEISPCNTA